ncbi:hypothetical protein SAMN05444365_104488 [Micromonospora pattaloongensis]|uniref:Streptogrisin C n=1 Tax=Micromonospora pattaloongensis TaxID=405436 RepID=A0A1H3PEZ4_9ACTN|nr:hypothetical protein [Micromonospora pattaloongensis]SDY99650.1 hypothetical protein SAMN05444365_104488 [Micromonospora pattaloongensis]
MLKTKRTFVGAVVATTAALTVLGALPAQAAPGKDKEPARAAAKVDESRAPDRAAGVRAASSAATAALATIQTRVARYVATNGTRYTFGSYLDPATGNIVLETDAPAGVVSALTDLSGAATAQRQAATGVQVRRASATDAWHRRDDIQPYYGGGGITAGGAICSSGYAVQNAAGTRFSVTAGHCWANGTSVSTESGANNYGTVSDRRLASVTGDAMDFELIGGRSYSGRVFTGGVTSTSSIPVVAAGTAYVGYTDYCHSGRTTGENCGHTANSITAQVCTATGCKSPVIAFTGGTMIQPGDSGGSFYAKDASGAWIRGNVIATNGVTGYAQPWTVISANLGVSIVTG